MVAGAGERGLCAGGDVVALYHSAKVGGADARAFFFDEYRLNSRIGHYPKPYVALMNGIVMGGGVGISGHGNVRVVTETCKIAMPEVGIGFIPDVGGTYLLSRAPGLLGLHAALTGAPFGAGDAIAMGFADHFVPQAELEAFTADDRRRRCGERGGRPRRRAAGRVRLPRSGTGSTTAMPATPSPTSSPRCAATTTRRPTAPPT